MQKLKKHTLIFLIFLITSFLPACDTSPSSDIQQNRTKSSMSVEDNMAVDQKAQEDPWAPFGKYKETIEFTQGRSTEYNYNIPAGDTLENNDWSRYVENRVNVRMKIAWKVESSSYCQKVALSISSGDIPDVMMVDRSSFMEMVSADLVEDMTEAYNRSISPYLRERYESYGPRIFDEVTFQGRLLGIPGCQLGGGHQLLWVRQDWLNKLGLKAPKTIDDIIYTARMFMEKDPGNNGAGKTIGLVMPNYIAGFYNWMYGLDTIFSLYDAYPKQWIEDTAGKPVYGSTVPGMKLALGKVREMYKAGITDKHFAARKGEDTNTLIAEGKCGMMFGPWWAPYAPLMMSVENDHDADWKPFVAPVDSRGKLNAYSQDPLNNIVVVRKGYAHPEAIVKVINAEQEALRAQSPEGIALAKKMSENGINWGIIPIPIQIEFEDETYRCYKQLTEAVKARDETKVDSVWKPYYKSYFKNAANPRADAAAWGEAISRFNGQAFTFSDQINIRRTVFYGITPTMGTRWANLQKLESETFLKIILGNVPIDAFDKFVQEWRKNGGDEITDEVRNMINQR